MTRPTAFRPMAGPYWTASMLHMRALEAARAEREAHSVPVERRGRRESACLTWRCPACREFTMPSRSRDGRSCHACGAPRPE